MRHYEIVALIHPNHSDNIDDLVAKYRRMIETSGGAIHRFENWGRRRLAYPIQNLFKANYILLNIECTPAVKNELENAFRYNDSIIRNLVIRVEKAITGHSPVYKKLLDEWEEERIAEEEARAQQLKEEQLAEQTKAAASASASDESASDKGRDSQSESVAEKTAAKGEKQS